MCIPDIEIGFALHYHTFNEPDERTIVQNVSLIKEDGRVSEQTYGLVISVTDFVIITGIAELGSDFSLSNDPMQDSVSILFPPSAQSINFTFFLEADDLIEGTEGFEAFISFADGFPTFDLPSDGNAFADVQVTIMDNDCESTNVCHMQKKKC